MRIVILTRYPRVDTPPWKRDLAERLLAMGGQVAVHYSRSGLVDHVRAGLREYGPELLERWARQRPVCARENEHPNAPRSLAEWARERNVEVVLHRRLDSKDSLASLRRLSPDVLLLAGSDIVPPVVLEIPRLGALNPHYGLLPAYRGMNVTEWSIYQDDPVGVTVHDVDAGIDTGDIVLRRQVVVEHGDDLSSLRTKHQRLAQRLMAEATDRLMRGTASRLGQRIEDGRQYYRMHPILRRRVEEKLAVDSYDWIGRRDDSLDYPG